MFVVLMSESRGIKELGKNHRDGWGFTVFALKIPHILYTPYLKRKKNDESL